TNATVDPSISWATGMSPSQVSPSSRAMMAAVAKYRDDIAGRLTTSGTSTSYTVTTNSNYNTPPPDGTRLGVTFHLTNGSPAVIAVDGGGTRQINIAPGVAAPAASLVAGTPYDLVYSTDINAWLVVGVQGQPTAIPLGGIIDYAGTTAPNSNFAMLGGQCISRTTYAALFALVGTTFSGCDGSTTFGLPDLRGRVVAGLDNLNGSPAGRISAGGGNFDGTVLGGTGGSQNHILTVAELPPHTPSGSVSGTPSGTVSISDPGHVHGAQQGTNFLALQGGGPSATISGSGNVNAFSSTASATTGITATFNGSSINASFSGNSIGSGNAHTILPPMMTLGKIIRIF